MNPTTNNGRGNSKPLNNPKNSTTSTILQRASIQTSSSDNYDRNDLRRGTRVDTGGLKSTGGETNNRSEFRRAPATDAGKIIKSSSREPESYGLVCATKPAFGFLQPIIGEDQVYFSQREFYPNMKIGDKVAYVARTGNKGLQAENLRFLTPHLEKVVTLAKGTVVRSPDRHRSGMGLIEVDLSSLKPEGSASLLGGAVKVEVPYRTNDVQESSIPKHHRLDKGDTVEFSISKVHDSFMLFACNVKLIQLKRDRLIAVQIQRMLDAGAVREVGVISMLRKGEFGFIKAQDRKDEIYFRVEDIVEDEDEEGKVTEARRVTEGSEVDFFVTVECIKGKMSDRAIHLKAVPKGTVRFEVLLAKQVKAVVVEENVSYPSEVPGRVRLVTPVAVGDVTGTKGEVITSIELWQRCLPDELQCRVGDEIVLDVQYYRPEKLFFARSVVVSSFRQVGREYGVVVSKKGTGFGFVYSQHRNMDIYFKSTHVVGLKGEIMNEASVEVNQYVSFEIAVDESSSGSRLRAHRVQREDDEITKERIASANKHIMLKNVIGVVVRNAVRKDSPGLIRVHSSFVTAAKEATYTNHELLSGLSQFRDCPELKKVAIQGLTLSLLKGYSQILDQKFAGISYETTQTSVNDASAGKTLTLTKLSAEEYDKWLVTNASSKSPIKASQTAIDRSDLGPLTVQFFREDYESSCFGPLANDLKVVFDLCWEDVKGKKVARTIRLTDEPVLDAPDKLFGVMEVVVEKEKNEPFGFIRCTPNDEKLFWHCSETFLPYGQDLKTGTDVSFMMRRRGGMRCAVDIEVLAPHANSRQDVLVERVQGVVVENGEVVLTDVSTCPLLHTKFLDLKLMQSVTASERDPKNSSSEKSSWEKLTLTKLAVDADGSLVPLDEADIAVELRSESTSASPVPLPDSTVEEDSELEYKPKYFSALPRLGLPLTATSSSNGYVPVAGDVVSFQPVVNWAVQRSPVAVINLQKLPTITACRRKGTINRLKFRVKNPESSVTAHLSEEALSCYALSSVEFVEILLEKTKEQRVEELGNVVTSTSKPTECGEYAGQYFYCDVREVRLSSELSRDLVQQGDEVDFWTTSDGGNLAFAVVLAPKLAAKEIQFGLKRGPVNAELKENKIKSGAVNIVTMAQGPPNDQAHGFEAGWRDAANLAAELNVKALPWAAMLTHLKSN